MTVEDAFGSGNDLTALQMAMRAGVMFFVMLVLARLSGMRAFGRKSSFDAVVAITMGAVLSRAIVGASPVIPTIAAATVLAVIHRIVAILTAVSPALEHVIKGHSYWVYREGHYDEPRMRRAGISKADIREAVRKRGHEDTLRGVREVRLESNGELTVVL
jgi:uncharacterized membrane protein YcaP (DUF421 family)